ARRNIWLTQECSRCRAGPTRPQTPYAEPRLGGRDDLFVYGRSSFAGRQPDRSRRGNRRRQRMGARPRQRRGDDRRDLRPLVRLPDVLPVAGGAERAAFFLRLRHEGAETAAWGALRVARLG